MAAAIFPSDTSQDWSHNGVLYSYDEASQRWYVVSSNAADTVIDELQEVEQRVGSLEQLPVPKDYILGTDKDFSRIQEPRTTPAVELVDSEGYYSNVKFEAGGGLQVTSTPMSIIYDSSTLQTSVNDNSSDINTLQAKVFELEVTKGSVARYKIDAVDFQIAARNGDLVTNSASITEITLMSIAPFDLNGAQTKPVTIGDIIEFNLGDGNVARYTVLDGDSPQGLSVVNNNGSGNISVGQFIDVYIYPQNKSGASFEYVDEQDTNLKSYTDAQLALKADKTAAQSYLPLSGGTLTGALTLENKPINFRGDGLHFFHANGDVLAKLYRSGDTNLKLNVLNGKQFIVTGTDTTGANRTFMTITNQDSAGVDGEDFRCNIFHLATPTSDLHAANKKYVDDAVSGPSSVFNELRDEVEQNEEQLQALSTNFLNTVFNVQNLVSEIQELKARLNNLENG